MLIILILMATSWETLRVRTDQIRHFCEYFAEQKFFRVALSHIRLVLLIYSNFEK